MIKAKIICPPSAGFFICEMVMPHKTSDFIMSVLIWLRDATVIHAGLMAFALSYMRAMYDEREKRYQRRLLEAMICACLATSSWGLIKLLEWPDVMAVAVGGFIGYLGVDKLREIILIRLHKPDV